jgi:UDP-N-acetyl-2-amino-2-deoxyglucuronate dehydrogenase
MSTVRFGIIGCGVIGPVHAQSLAHLPQTTLVGVCDSVPARAQRVAAEFGAATWTTDYHQLLARADIDAVCICTPHYLHAEMAQAAAAAGKHIFCEKPMAIAVADLDAMEAAATRAGVQLGICFQHRFDPVALHLKRLIEEGHFGQLLLGGAHCQCLRTPAYYASEPWRGRWLSEGGGVLINQAIHTLDLLVWLFGEATSISGTYGTLCWQDTIEVEDTASGVIGFASGAQGHLVATSASHLDWNTRLHVYGTRGSAVMNTGFPNEFTFLELADGAAAFTPPEETAPTVGKDCYGNSHWRALSAFADAIRTGTPYPITAREGRRAVEIVLGLYRSSRAGTAVPLPLSDAVPVG